MEEEEEALATQELTRRRRRLAAAAEGGVRKCSAGGVHLAALQPLSARDACRSSPVAPAADAPNTPGRDAARGGIRRGIRRGIQRRRRGRADVRSAAACGDDGWGALEPFFRIFPERTRRRGPRGPLRSKKEIGQDHRTRVDRATTPTERRRGGRTARARVPPGAISRRRPPPPPPPRPPGRTDGSDGTAAGPLNVNRSETRPPRPTRGAPNKAGVLSPGPPGYPASGATTGESWTGRRRADAALDARFQRPWVGDGDEAPKRKSLRPPGPDTAAANRADEGKDDGARESLLPRRRPRRHTPRGS